MRDQGKRVFKKDEELIALEDSVKERFPMATWTEIYYASMRLFASYLSKKDDLKKKGFKPNLWSSSKD